MVTALLHTYESHMNFPHSAESQHLHECECILTVEGVQVDRESAGLTVAFATFSTHVRPVPSVRSHMTRQLNGLGEDGFTVLTHIHLS